MPFFHFFCDFVAISTLYPKPQLFLPHRVVSTPTHITQMLIDRFKLLSSTEFFASQSKSSNPQINEVQRAIIQVFETWIDKHGEYDFDDDSDAQNVVPQNEALKNILNFANEYLGEDSNLAHDASQLQDSLTSIYHKRIADGMIKAGGKFFYFSW